MNTLQEYLVRWVLKHPRTFKSYWNKILAPNRDRAERKEAALKLLEDIEKGDEGERILDEIVKKYTSFWTSSNLIPIAEAAIEKIKDSEYKLHSSERLKRAKVYSITKKLLPVGIAGILFSLVSYANMRYISPTKISVWEDSCYVRTPGLGLSSTVYYQGDGEESVQRVLFGYSWWAGKSTGISIEYVDGGREGPLDGRVDEITRWDGHSGRSSFRNQEKNYGRFSRFGRADRHFAEVKAKAQKHIQGYNEATTSL